MVEDWAKPSEALKRMAEGKPTMPSVCFDCAHRHRKGENCGYPNCRCRVGAE